MTRDDFVTAYMSRSGFTDYTVDGERVCFNEDDCWLALPCACDDDDCEGWAMVPPSSRDAHMRHYGPKGAAA